MEGKRTLLQSYGGGRTRVTSDHLAIAAAVEAFRGLPPQQVQLSALRQPVASHLTIFPSLQAARREYCARHGLLLDTMQEITHQQRDLVRALAGLGFVQSEAEGLRPSQPCNRNSRRPKVLIAALCAG